MRRPVARRAALALAVQALAGVAVVAAVPAIASPPTAAERHAAFVAEVLALMERMTPAERSIFLTVGGLLRDGWPHADVHEWAMATVAVVRGDESPAALQRMLDAAYRVGGPKVREGRV